MYDNVIDMTRPTTVRHAASIRRHGTSHGSGTRGRLPFKSLHTSHWHWKAHSQRIVSRWAAEAWLRG